METALAIIIGAVMGVIGFLPLFGGLRLSRRVPSSNLGMLGACLIGLFTSFIILMVAALVCISVARAETLPFVLSEAIALSISAIIYGIVKMTRH